jgi:hypothetical protein
MLQCRIGHVMSFVDLCSKPDHGAQRQVSVMYGLLMCDILGVHISKYVS